MGDDSDKSAESSDLRDTSDESEQDIYTKTLSTGPKMNACFKAPLFWPDPGIISVEVITVKYADHPVLRNVIFGGKRRAIKGVIIAPPLWPSDGHIVFRDVSARYAAHLNPVVRNLTVEIKAGEKHRVSTILDADKIITLENGVMVEYGDPQTLMKKEGSVFASLVSADK
ncbi:uncharacterized protein [Apostichopus japonicus]|uniref:uncharacterized protein isoform X1 n=1 Tax=Stichopus japonicus TaxID=307972 RepID=UPI003AB7A09D